MGGSSSAMPRVAWRLAAALVVLVLTGALAAPSPARAAPGDLQGTFPANGGVVPAVWGGGSMTQLLQSATAHGCAAPSVWVFSGGQAVGYVVGAPDFVSAGFNALYPGGPPAGTIVLLLCAPALTSPNTIGFVPTQPPTAVEGQEYPRFTFCEPTPSDFRLGACGPGTTNPTGGNPPYHFQLDPGSGFPPLGMSLLKDGQLTGTPVVGTGGRTYTFRVCAVDLSGNQVCADVVIAVVAAAATPTPTPTPRPTATPAARSEYRGTLSGSFGSIQSLNGCQWSLPFTADLDTVVESTAGGAISGQGTATVSITFVTTYEPSDVQCNPNSVSATATGTVSGTSSSMQFNLAGPRDLTVSFAGTGGGEAMTGPVSLSRTFGTTSSLGDTTESRSTTVPGVTLQRVP